MIHELLIRIDLLKLGFECRYLTLITNLSTKEVRFGCDYDSLYACKTHGDYPEECPYGKQ